MRTLTTAILLVLMTSYALAGASGGASTGPSVRDNYSSPTITVPYANTAPTIDGVMAPGEWDHAVSLRALQTVRGRVSIRQSTWYVAWDEENLYLAFHSPLRPGERVIQNKRQMDRDINVVYDDSYEIWLDVGTFDPKTGLKSFYQFLCNFAGARYDAIHLPSVGNWRLGYQTGWKPANGISKDNAWVMELRIPRESLGKKTPFADGYQFTGLLARNYKRPWEQNSICGTGAFSALDTHSKLRLSKTDPALHLLYVGNPKDGKLGLELSAVGQKDGMVQWTFASDSGVKKQGSLEIKKDKPTAIAPLPALDETGKGYYRITVADAQGTPLLDWSSERMFGNRKGDYDKIMVDINDPGNVIKANLNFNPVHNYVKVNGDFINYDARGRIANVRVAARDKDGKVLGSGEYTIDNLSYIDGTIPTGNIPHGQYTVTMDCLDADGKTVVSRKESFEKKDHTTFPWWNTKHGDMDNKVVPPWTPVVCDEGFFKVWGRQMQIGPAGLPKRIDSQDKPLLAAPIALLMKTPDGTLTAAKGDAITVKSKKSTRVDATVQSTLGEDIKVSSDVQVEFDGMVKVTMTLTPSKPVKLDALYVNVPLTNTTADYIHAVGEGIRTGYYYGFLPKDKTGTIWTCRTVDSQPMVVGSFIPYVWIGTTTGGLAWFADSDEGWVPNDNVPAMEVVRDDESSTDFRLNLISEPLTLEEPRTITFAFQATPVKPMHKQWRMDSWWCGDTFKNFSNTASVIWTAIPFPRDVEKSRKMVANHHKGTNRYVFGLDKYKSYAVPYFIHQTLPALFVPEVKYFGDQWKTSISECLYYGPTLTDYMVHNYAEWAKSCGIDGFYVDNMRPVACDNIHAERGYRLPDGRIQPTYQMFSTRRYFMRLRAAFQEVRGHSKMVLHMTNCMIIPWVGPADVAYDGELNVIYPDSGKDFMDEWSLERLRVDVPGQWGTAVNFMHEYQGKWSDDALAKAIRAYSGAIVLHDALPSGNGGMNQPLWIGRDRFGIENDDVQFLGYWNPQQGIAGQSDTLKVACWKRPGKVLLAVVNFGEKTNATLTLDATTLGLADPAGWTVTDAEDGTSVKGRRMVDGKREIYVAWDADDEGDITRSGDTLTVPVKRHDYRQVIIESTE